MPFKADFIETLKTLKQLPITSFQSQFQILTELQYLREKNLPESVQLSKITTMQEEIEKNDTTISEKENAIINLSKIISEKDQILAKKEDLIATKDKELEKCEEQFADISQELQRKIEILVEKEKQIAKHEETIF